MHLLAVVEKAVIGTSSQRRLAQLKVLRPDIVVKDVRGNVDTRLRKLDEGQYECADSGVGWITAIGFAGED